MSGGLPITFDAAAWRPLVALVVAELLERLQAARPDKLADTEAEAATLIGLNTRQLGDGRRNLPDCLAPGPGAK